MSIQKQVSSMKQEAQELSGGQFIGQFTPHAKDYAKSLNQGLYNAFHAKHIMALFDCIIKDVVDAESIPDNEEELKSWVTKIVREVLILKEFKTHLARYVIKAIQKAPLKKKEPEIAYQSSLSQSYAISKSAHDDSF
jgi:flagellar biosynthesis/type III secretory pathway protein FliH